MSHRPSPRSIVSLLVGLLLLSGLALPVAAQGPDRPGRPAPGPGSVEVLHGPVSITLSDAASDGHQLGDLRVASVPTTDASGHPLGRLDATLITTAIDSPEPRDEIRISTLVFSFGEAGEHQVVVGGSAVYPAQGGTLATGTVTTRPIQGGSGRFAGADGWAVSEHLEDGSWRHTLVFTHAGPAVRVQGGGHGVGPGAFEPGDLFREFVRRHLVVRMRDRDRDRLAPATGPGSTVDGARPSIIRTGLGVAAPDSAPGQDLGLWHYTIPAGSTLEPHQHPGWQIARIIRGELSYTIITGEAEVLAVDGSSRIIGLGTHVLRTGDSVIEHPALEHYGANLSHRDVEILAATLYPDGAPLSIPVPTPSPPVASPSP